MQCRHASGLAAHPMACVLVERRKHVAQMNLKLSRTLTLTGQGLPRAWSIVDRFAVPPTPILTL